MTLPEFNLSKVMDEARRSDLFTDVTLVVADGKEFKAHKAVLASLKSIIIIMVYRDFKRCTKKHWLKQ